MNGLNVLGKMGYWIKYQVPIADKIGIPLAVIAVLTATTMSSNIVALTRQQIDRTYKVQARQLAGVVQAEFQTHNHNLDDRSSTSQFLAALKRQDPSILDIHIYRLVDQKPLLWAASSQTEREGNPIKETDIAPILTGEPSQVSAEAKAELETVVPVFANDKIVASLAVYTSLEARNQAINNATRTIVLTSALGISAQSIALMLVLYWTVLRRLQKLSQAARRVAKGDTTIHFPEAAVVGQDEVLNVTHQFAQMLNAVKSRSRNQEALAELGQQALEEIDLSELLEKVTQLVMRTLTVDGTHVYEFLPDLSGLQLRSSTDGEMQQQSALRILPLTPDSLFDQALHGGNPVVIDDITTEQRFQDLQALKDQGVISSISVLVTNYEKPFGVLSAYRKQRKPFSRDDIFFLKAVASLLSTAIDRHRVETVMAQAEAALARAAIAETAKQALEKEIVERQRVEQALRESEERYALAASGANDGLWDWNLSSNEIYFSTRWKAMLGYEEEEIGNNPNEWFDRIHPDDYERVQMELRHHREGLTAHFESEFRLRQKDQTYHWMLSRGLAVRDATGSVYRIVGSQTDVTGRKLAEEQLLHIALHDELTGLANRALFSDRLDRAIARTQRRQRSTFAVLFLDLDRFKVINDSLGHLVGDQLLITTSERLKKCLRSSDTCARLGGDEFAILLEDIQTAEDATLILERIQAELRVPFMLANQEVFINASIGVVLDTGRYHNKEELLRDADTAMYCSKASGRGCYTIFTPVMHEQAVTLLHLEAELRRAIERQELCLFYQPILALNGQRFNGFEALLRWQHPQRGLLLPVDFIAVAEETGLIISIGWWVLQQACTQMRQWQQAFQLESHVTMSVNLSGKQFAQPDLVEQVSRILQETGLEPQYLKLEITENVIMTDADAAAATMQRLKTLGVQLAMDDFGTGYSSLSYLHRFPIDTLKIDRSFINSADDDLEKLEITRTVIALAWNLGMSVVAEGVETDRQMAQLKLLKCELAQGFLFSQPLDSVSATGLLSQGGMVS